MVDYAGLVRLSVVAAGVVSIVLGYRLFVLGVMPKGGSDAGMEAGDIKLTLKNAALGTCFALFGVAVIIFLLSQGLPRIELPGGNYSQYKARDAIERAAGPPDSIEARAVRDASVWDDFSKAQQQGLDLRKTGNDEAALMAFSEALAVKNATLQQAAGPLREVAEIYLEQGRSAEALPLARIAAGLQDNDPAYLNTLAQVSLAQNQMDEAVAAVKRGLEIAADSPKLLHTKALISEAKGELADAVAVMEQAAARDQTLEDELRRLRSKM